MSQPAAPLPTDSVPTEFNSDLPVIGSGPGGQRAAKLGKKVAVVEKKSVVGGVCTIPSKTFREAIMHLSGYDERGLYGEAYAVKSDITVQDLLLRTSSVMAHELDVVRNQLHRNRVEVIKAEASFVGPFTVRLRDVKSGGVRDVNAHVTVIATGRRAARDSSVHFDGHRIISDDILDLSELPRTVTVVGGGVRGCE